MSKDSSSFQIVVRASIFSAVLVAAFGAPVADSQGVAARATVAPKPPTTDELNVLKKKIESLTERVTELEKPEIDPSKDDDEGAARFAKLEKQLAALQKEVTSVATEAASTATAASTGGAAGTTVRAPFKVVDRTGNTMLVVQDNGKGGSLALAGKSGTSVVVIDAGITGESGKISLARGGRDNVILGGTAEKGGGVIVYDSKSNPGAQLYADGLHTFNPSGQVIAEFGSVASGNSGRLWLGNSAGEAIVEGGMLTSGEGVVRAGPRNGAPPSALRLPDRIVGHLR